jgi:hypothetical protein
MYICYMRNSLAGTKKGKSESAKYFQSNPKAKAKKDEYNKEYHSTPERRKYRSELNKENRKAGTTGNKDGKDMSHTKSGKVVKESQSANRRRNGKGGTPRLK